MVLSLCCGGARQTGGAPRRPAARRSRTDGVLLHEVEAEGVRAGIVATLRRHRNDDRDELSAHEWLYQERRVHHDVSIEDYCDLCRSHWAGFAKFMKWMHYTHTL